MNGAQAWAVELSAPPQVLHIAHISYPTKSCHDMSKQGAEGRFEVVGLEEEWDNRQPLMYGLQGRPGGLQSDNK